MTPVPHPAKGILAIRRISNRQVANAYQSSHHYVGRVLNGHIPPSPRFRRFLAAHLGMPEADLFLDDEGAFIGGDAA